MSKLSKLKFIIIILFSVILNSCNTEKNKSEDDITISVTLAPFADFTKKIVRNRAKVFTLISDGENAHSFDPNPQTIKQLLNSDIYLRVGEVFTLENQIVNRIDKNNTRIIDCSEGINIVDNDPHYWLSVKNAKLITNNILTSLIEKYPQHKNYFSNNKSRFVEKLDSMYKKIKSDLSKKSNKYLFVYHPAWKYFADEFGLVQISIEKDGKTPKAKDFKDVLNNARQMEINCIFFDPHFDDSAVLTIAKSLELNTESLNPIPSDYLANLTEILNKLKINLR